MRCVHPMSMWGRRSPGESLRKDFRRELIHLNIQFLWKRTCSSNSDALFAPHIVNPFFQFYTPPPPPLESSCQQNTKEMHLTLFLGKKVAHNLFLLPKIASKVSSFLTNIVTKHCISKTFCKSVLLLFPLLKSLVATVFINVSFQICHHPNLSEKQHLDPAWSQVKVASLK